MVATNTFSGTAHGPTAMVGRARDVYVGVQPPSVPEPQVRAWGDPVDLPPAVVSLLRAQFEAAEYAPHKLPGARNPTLSTVYVRQGLGNSIEERVSEQPRPVLDERGSWVEPPMPKAIRLSVRPPAKTVREALDGDAHLLVVGAAGQGKSTLSLRLASNIAACWLNADAEHPLGEPVLPLRVTARELAGRRGSFPEVLAESLRAEYDSLLHSPPSPDLLSRRFAGCRWLLLVDGLDEVADPGDQERLVKALARCATDSPYRVVLTSRPLDGTVLAPLHRVGARRYELQPFDEEALKRFAAQWFDEGPEVAERFIREIDKAHLGELVSVPLLATLAAIVFEQRGWRPLPDSQYELYEAYLGFLLSLRTPSAAFAPHRTPLLEHLGRVRVETDTSLAAAAREWTAEHAPAVQLDDLTSAGLLTVRNDDLRFLHHSFAEHLAATSRAKELPESFSPGEPFATLLHTARGEDRGRFARSVLLHHSHLHPSEADPLLRWLHDGDREAHLLAARLLAMHLPTGTDATAEFFTTARAWAMTNQYPSLALVSRVSRATGHPGLRDWLLDLMRDPLAPWATRTEAATALGVRLRGEHREEAIAFLTALVDDGTATARIRLGAAEALSEAGAAHRAPAERGLRAVLTDRYASAENHRTAAVLLATMGPDGNRDAVAFLLGELDDRETPPGDLVTAATGLLEIDFAHQTKAAAVYRRVLNDHGSGTLGWDDAALGMSQLGPEHTAEAVRFLQAVVQDRAQDCSIRVSAAQALAGLGPQYEAVAGELTITLLEEPGRTIGDRYTCASALSKFGLRFRDRAVEELRAVITHHSTSTVLVRMAAGILGGLGPEYFDEAAEVLWALLVELPAHGQERASALSDAATLGTPHRDRALGELHELMTDRLSPALDRCEAAMWLIASDPRFHAEARTHLVEIAGSAQDPAVALRAWQRLLSLDASFQGPALAFLLDLLAAPPDDLWLYSIAQFTGSSEDRQVVGDALASVAASSAGLRVRFSALSRLVQLGKPFHRRAADLACDLTRSATVLSFDFPYLAGLVSFLSAPLRREIADAMHEVLHASPQQAVTIAKAVIKLGFGSASGMLEALRSAFEHPVADRGAQREAGVLLARIAPTHLASVTRQVLAPEGEVVADGWGSSMKQLASMGAVVVPGLVALIDNETYDYRVRMTAGQVLCSLIPSDGRGLTSLRHLVVEEHLPLAWRSDAHMLLAAVSESDLGAAVAFHREVAGDETARAHDRAWAAVELTRVDRSTAQSAVSLLRDLRDSDRAEYTNWLIKLDQHTMLEADLITEIARNFPHISGSLLPHLPRSMRTEVERDLLEDRTLSPKIGTPAKDVWDNLPLQGEAEMIMRDHVSAPESDPAERVAAVEALLSLSTRLADEAVDTLRELTRRPSHRRRALRALAESGTEGWQDVVPEAVRIASDRQLPPRDRVAAMSLVADIAPPELADGVRDLSEDLRLSVRDRVAVLYALRHVIGLSPLRRVRDDELTPTAARCQAGALLKRFTSQDRVAEAHLLETIAHDRAAPSALRVRSAVDLLGCGAAGRRQALPLLLGLAQDEALSVSARTKAARALVKDAPASRAPALKTLRNLLPTTTPLQRRRVWLAIGVVEPAEAALGLLEMARNPDHTPVARVRCAEAATTLRRAWKDKAAVTVREIAFDTTVPWHVRRTAARHLARWSEVCREEARELLRSLPH
ncbi:NACHT domain-containing protein [Actinosynnema pretiosum]|uniref:NACHT domain-containing protein n=1 Tax=Actinosynnema pretiosum TaxID=42197 RepID=UPI0012FDB5DE|nr:NACHT domain-containing protein [Actinosynnema pretiosum]